MDLRNPRFVCYDSVVNKDLSDCVNIFAALNWSENGKGRVVFVKLKEISGISKVPLETTRFFYLFFFFFLFFLLVINNN